MILYQNKFIQKLMKFILLYTIISIFILNSSVINDAIYFSLIPIIFALYLITSNKISLLRYDEQLKVIRIATIFLTLIFIVQLSLSQIIYGLFQSENIFIVNHFFLIELLFKVIYPIILFISTYLSIYYIFTVIPMKPRETTELKKIKYLGLYNASIPSLIISVIFILSAYPFIQFPDPSLCWNFIVEGIWSESHTIGYLLFIKLCTFIIHSPYMVTVIQTIFWIFIVNEIIDTIYKYTQSRKAVYTFVIISSLIFTPFVYLQLMLKDVVYSMALLLFCIEIFRINMNIGERKRNAILLVIAGISASLFRHGQLISIIVSCLVLIAYFSYLKDKRSKVFIISSCIILISNLIVTLYVSPVLLKATKNPGYIKYSVPMQMIGAIAKNEGNLSEKTINDLESIMPISLWKDGYSDKYFADPISREWGVVGENIIKLNDTENGLLVLKLNAQFLIEYPLSYLTAFFDINSIVWEIATPQDGYQWAPVKDACTDYDQSIISVIPSGTTKITNTLAEFSVNLPIIRSLFWRGGIWLFTIMLSITSLLLKRRNNEAISFIPIFITTAMLMISIPAQDFRFVLWLLEIGIFSLIIMIFDHKQQNSKNDC